MADKTYQIGRRHRRSKKLIVMIIVVLLVAGGSGYLYRQYSKETTAVIKNPAGTTKPLVIPNSQQQHFDYGLFSFDAPVDWKLVKHDTAPYSLYSYRSTLKNADNRTLDIYADGLPQNLAVNKAVDVRGQGATLSHGVASDNCTTFTSGGQQGAGMQGSSGKPLTIPSKWNGVEFICDNDNTTRNVIGTSAPGMVNKVVLNGPTGGQHAFFFVYTDNNATADYNIFYKMLDSFTVK
jgi:hypothetical protein